jgi:Ca-activated chloride channel family protein
MPNVVALILLSLSIATLPLDGLSSRQASTERQRTTSLIMLDVTVTDKRGVPITTLDKESFTVLDKKQAVDIAYFSAEDFPISVGIVFDLSQSMPIHSSRWFEGAMQGISSFVAEANPSNEYFIVAFGEWPKVFVDWTRDRAAIEEGLNKLRSTKPVRATALFDACKMALDKLARRDSAEKKVILLISDGMDTNSNIQFSQLEREFRDSGVLLYAARPVDLLNSLAGYGESVMKSLTVISGGAAYAVGDASEIEKTLKNIAIELRHQYRLGFRPKAFDGKWHTLRIKVASPADKQSGSDKVEIKARTREGYLSASGSR